MPSSKQQDQHRAGQQLGTLGLAGQSVEALAEGVKLFNSHLQQLNSAAGAAILEVDRGGLAPGFKAAEGVEGRPGQPDVPGLGRNPDDAGPAPWDSSTPAQQSSQSDQARLPGARDAALDSASVPPVLPEIPKRPTEAMLAYAAAAAQPAPRGMTCEAWLAQADQRE